MIPTSLALHGTFPKLCPCSSQTLLGPSTESFNPHCETKQGPEGLWRFTLKNFWVGSMWNIKLRVIDMTQGSCTHVLHNQKLKFYPGHHDTHNSWVWSWSLWIPALLGLKHWTVQSGWLIIAQSNNPLRSLNSTILMKSASDWTYKWIFFPEERDGILKSEADLQNCKCVYRRKGSIADRSEVCWSQSEKRGCCSASNELSNLEEVASFAGLVSLTLIYGQCLQPLSESVTLLFFTILF